MMLEKIIEKMEEASKKGQERLYLTHAELLEIRHPDPHKNVITAYCELPYECRKIPNLMGCFQGTLIIQKSCK